MTKPFWIIEKLVFENTDAIVKAAIASGCDVEIVECGCGMPPERFRDSVAYPPERCLIAYGSINFVRGMLECGAWTPTAWLDAEELNCRTYYAYLGKFLLQQEYLMLPWSEFVRKKDYLYKAVGYPSMEVHVDGTASLPLGKKQIFVRPADNLKSISSGTLVEHDKFDHWAKMTANCYEPDPELLVVVARPQQVLAEWRFWMTKDRIVSQTGYGPEGCSFAAIPSEADLLALEVAREWGKKTQAPMFVVDVCRACTGETGFRLVEIGSANTCSMYGADAAKIVGEMTEQAQRQWEKEWD